ncbi:hypothetical protein [Mycobacterium sp. 1465703.0]|nr:hypothetical protein [Mycobacterium sp. 1465703.0]
MTTSNATSPLDRRVQAGLTALAWLWVALPFAYGIGELLTKVTQLLSN